MEQLVCHCQEWDGFGQPLLKPPYALGVTTPGPPSVRGSLQRLTGGGEICDRVMQPFDWRELALEGSGLPLLSPLPPHMAHGVCSLGREGSLFLPLPPLVASASM